MEKFHQQKREEKIATLKAILCGSVVVRQVLMKIFLQLGKGGKKSGESADGGGGRNKLLLQEINDKLRFIFLDADRILFY